jgi:hypothetical protein
MDTCENCNQTKKKHIKQEDGSRPCPVGGLPRLYFTPLLRTVKTICLVKRCKCGHAEKAHVVGKDKYCRNCYSCKYMPVQMVEITTGGIE